MPVVTSATARDIINSFENHTHFALDLETTGLDPYQGAKIFSCIISTDKDDFYFNFDNTPDHLGNYAPAETILDISLIGDILKKLSGTTVFIHNAKFDARFLLVIKQLEILNARIVCTQALARLVNNRLHSYALAALGPLVGHAKDDTVEKYISKHKLYTLVEVGKAKPRKGTHYDLVPFDIISSYGMKDGRACYALGTYVLKRLKEMDEEQVTAGLPALAPLVETEITLTKVLLDMEDVGIKIDREYTRRAYEYACELYQDVEQKFYAITGIDFEDKNAVLKEAFTKAGYQIGLTEKGNPSFSDENLPNNTLGNLVREWRNKYKMAHTYYKNFLDMADDNGVIHCSFNQGGTSTGRLSASNPNLQNVPKKDDSNAYPVRACFIPREGYFFAMLDYQAQEYRLLLDVAGEQATIDKILKQGLDVHTATAELMGTERTYAKMLNFMLLYGGGAQKLADALKLTLLEAKALKDRYFRALKGIQKIIKALVSTSERRGYIVTWAGRRIKDDKGFSYKAPNSYIQGGSADIMKHALVDISKYLKGKKSRLLATIHDEAALEVAYGEELILEEIKSIMIKAYPYHKLPMDVDIEYSKKNFYEREAWPKK